jgi:hypothetical protein
LFLILSPLQQIIEISSIALLHDDENILFADYYL